MVTGSEGFVVRPLASAPLQLPLTLTGTAPIGAFRCANFHPRSSQLPIIVKGQRILSSYTITMLAKSTLP